MIKTTKRVAAKPRPVIAKREEPKTMVEGSASAPRMDRPGYKRGGAVKAKGTTVNVVIAPQGAQAGAGGPPQPVPVPVPVRPPMGPPGPPAGLPPGAGPPPGLAGVPVGPGGPPMMRGGRLTAGAGSGVGRLQKMR